MVDDVRRLLDADGLAQVPVFAISARHGIGIDRLRAEIAERVGRQEGSPRPGSRPTSRPPRSGSAEASGTGKPRELSRPPGRPSWRTRSPTPPGCRRGRRRRAVDPAPRRPGHGVAGGRRGCPGSGPTRSSGCTSTSAPRAGSSPAAPARPSPRPRRCSAPGSTPRCATLADDASRRARPAVGRGRPPRLDLAARRPRRPARRARWPAPTSASRGSPRGPAPVRVLQWLLILAALAGAVWLGALALMELPPDARAADCPRWAAFPLPTLLLLGGVALGDAAGARSAGCWSG